MSGIVYLIQAEKDLGSNIYKVGMSSNNNMFRISSYGKNTRIFSIINCDNPLSVEKVLHKTFRKKYKLYHGREWYILNNYENEDDMINLFCDIVLWCKNNKKSRQNSFLHFINCVFNSNNIFVEYTKFVVLFMIALFIINSLMR